MSSIMEPMSLLDMSLAAEPVDFPSLQPFPFALPGQSVRADPVVRLGSPIDLEAELEADLEEDAEAEAEEPPEVIPAVAKVFPFKAGPANPAANQAPFKGRPGRYQSKKPYMAGKGKRGFSKKPPQGQAHHYLMRSGLNQLQPAKTTNRYSNTTKPPAGPANKGSIQPSWTLQSSSVFDNWIEERSAASFALRESSGPNSARDNTFFQWGLRYMPLASNATANAYRTVLIDHLPLQVTLDQILARIRGGQIYSATLLDTKPIIQSFTAMIVFVRESGAMAFLRRVADEGFYIGFRQAKVRPVPTPTYVLNPDMERNITRLGRTRCVVVYSPRPRLRKSIHNMLFKSPCNRHVEGFGVNDSPGQVTIMFFSIQMARVAYDCLTEHGSFEDCTLGFGPDPCA